MKYAICVRCGTHTHTYLTFNIQLAVLVPLLPPRYAAAAVASVCEFRGACSHFRPENGDEIIQMRASATRNAQSAKHQNRGAHAHTQNCAIQLLRPRRSANMKPEMLVCVVLSPLWLPACPYRHPRFASHCAAKIVFYTFI